MECRVRGEGAKTLEKVSSARRALDRARAREAVAQARLQAAMIRASDGGASQREVAARAGCSQPYVSQVISSGRDRFVPSSRLGYLLAAHRAEVLQIVERFGARNVEVFGSVARGEDGPNSDIDLLVDIPDEMGLFALSRMELAVADSLGAAVDLVPSRLLTPEVRTGSSVDAVAL